MLSVLARAKINLYLHVLGRDEQTGFHALETMVAFTDWADVLSFEPAETFSFTVSGPFAGIFNDAERTVARDSANLVVRAFYAVADAAGVAALRGHVHLVKNIPAGAGLGGGSADAAAAIALAQHAFGVTLDAPVLQALAARLGADVPMCVRGYAALYRGRGDAHVRDIRLPDNASALVVWPGAPTATADVFRDYRAASPVYHLPMASVPPKFATMAKLESFLAKTGNDLAGAAMAINPATRLAAQGLQQACPGATVRVTGSGSAVFVPGPRDGLVTASALINKDYPGVTTRVVQLV